jgi:hypothetical protein
VSGNSSNLAFRVTALHHSAQVSAPPVLESVRAAHERLLTHTDLQFDFPGYQPPVTPSWLIALADLLRGVWPVLRWFVWAGIAVLGVLLLYVIARAVAKRWFPDRLGPRPAAAAAPEWRPAPELARNLLRDADALAAHGAYGEAVHLLLLRGIEHIDENRPELVKPALTSREIGALDQLPTAARTAFGFMARIVERALFARRDIAASDFAQCRDAYERLAFPGALRCPGTSQ